MNTKRILILVILLAMPIIMAQEIDESHAGMTPDSAFYFLDMAFDEIRLAFAFTNENQARIGLEIAEERLAEMKVMRNRQNVEALNRARTEYEKNIARVNENILKVNEETRQRYGQRLQVHVQVLQEIQGTSPEQAKQGVANALEKSQQALGVLEILELTRNKTFPTPQPLIKGPCICTMEYAPVCGVDGKVYPNACFARCAGVAVAYKINLMYPPVGFPETCPAKGGIEKLLEEGMGQPEETGEGQTEEKGMQVQTGTQPAKASVTS